MDETTDDLIRVCSLDELKAKGKLVFGGARAPLLVIYDAGKVLALDNRCPHLGFPLHRGSIEDGILTCHWHHARFDLRSGATFDLWADDVPTCPVEIRDGEVWVARDCRHADEAGHWRRRLGDGMAHNIGLVIAKAVLGLKAAGAGDTEIIRQAALFGARNRDGWGSGLTVLAALGNLIPALPEDETYLAFYKGIRRVASDCDGEAPHRAREKLGEEAPPFETLKRWLRHWTLVRHRDGAERTLLTAIASGASPGALAGLLLSAVTDRYYADGGHALDSINKAFECLDVIGWDHASDILPSLTRQLVSAKGREESNSWRHPVDLVPLLESAFEGLPAAIEEGGSKPGPWTRHRALAEDILGDDAAAIAQALDAAVRQGARGADLGRALAYAAALRLARFGTANEHSDWNSAHHSFTYCNGLHQLLKRIETDGNGKVASDSLRGIYHGAMALYVNRFLNVPPAALPGARPGDFDGLPEGADDLLAGLLDVMDRQSQIDEAARIVARYLGLGHPTPPLIATLAQALLREDAGFHAYQSLEAGVRQYEEWPGAAEGGNVLIAITRFLAAHSPTERSQFQTAAIAKRLHRGGKIYQDETMEAETGA
ncbi:MAG: Rieske 2Fe-2S domain-containing protein [Proteobacteria bacterium]|nr:Rieske 2Fe-2S domain-containing protein [Pseudomonadota bacterium]